MKLDPAYKLLCGLSNEVHNRDVVFVNILIGFLWLATGRVGEGRHEFHNLGDEWCIEIIECISECIDCESQKIQVRAQVVELLFLIDTVYISFEFYPL